MKILLDTNVFIGLEPVGNSASPDIAKGRGILLGLAAENKHPVFLSAATLKDIERDTDKARKLANQNLAKKYQQIASIPAPSKLLDALAEPTKLPNENDEVDRELLAALWNNATEILVTEDKRLRARAKRAGLGERVYSLSEAIELLRELSPKQTEPPPAVELLHSYQLDASDPIFESLRTDYPGFDEWFAKMQKADRPAWVIKGTNGIAAIAIAKGEWDDEWPNLPSKTLKISTVKVADTAYGRRYGELLLKTVFAWAFKKHADALFVTTLPKQESLIDLFDEFGFYDSGNRTGLDELVFAKVLRPRNNESTPLQAHIQHGPPYVHPDAPLFIIPIQPDWDELLFPDNGRGLPIFAGVHPYGNALRKAYVSRSQITQLTPGSTLLFYRSSDVQGIVAVGVVEAVIRSSEIDEIQAATARRTVYSKKMLEEMLSGTKDLLVIQFRQDRFIQPPWKIKELLKRNVLAGPPQSIQQISNKEGIAWVRSQLVESQ